MSLLPLAIVLLFGRILDVVLLFSIGLYRNWDTVQNFINLYINPTIVIDTTKAAVSLFILLQIVRYIRGLKQTSSPSNDFPLKPLLFPSQTSHVRMFPTKHGFTYSYLLTGVPVGWRGSVGGMLSEDDSKSPTAWHRRIFSLDLGGAWYTINSDDYLDRGHAEGGLEEKLRDYLQGKVRMEPQILLDLLTQTRALIPLDLHMPTSSQPRDF